MTTYGAVHLSTVKSYRVLSRDGPIAQACVPRGCAKTSPQLSPIVASLFFLSLSDTISFDLTMTWARISFLLPGLLRKNEEVGVLK